MCSTKILILISFCISSVLSKNKPCDINDSKCIKESASRKFLDVVSGMPGVETSDPLHLDSFDINQPTIKIKMTDASLSGMKNCHMELVQYSPKEKTYHAYYECPHLIFQARYEINGYLGPQFVEGKGPCQVDHYDFDWHFNGEYDREVLDDGKKHIHLKNKELKIDARGKVQFDFKNLHDGDKEKSDATHQFANENWRFVTNLTSQRTMELFLNKHIENLNAFFKIHAVEDIFTY